MQPSTALFQPPTAAEEQLLDELRAGPSRRGCAPTRRRSTLIDWLTRNRPARTAPGRTSGCIIFTEYRDTQKWLQGLLAADGLSTARRLMLLYGGMDDEDRERDQGRVPGQPAGEHRCASCSRPTPPREGIDLQRHCHRLVHYEIPWNPNRLEQRNGRVDRHGQQHKPQIFHFVAAGLRATCRSTAMRRSARSKATSSS